MDPPRRVRALIRSFRPGGKKETEESSGTLELPLDVYNGMMSTVLNNLGKDEVATAHMMAFTPKPRPVKMTIRPDGTDPIIVGDSRRSTTRYVVEKAPCKVILTAPPAGEEGTREGVLP